MKTNRALLLILLALAAALAAHGVTVAWDDNSTSETGFALQRASGSAPDESAWAPLAELAANVTTFTDATATPGATYSYRIRATSGTATSAWSNVATYVPAPTAARTPATKTTYLQIRPGDSYTVKGSQLATRPGAKTINVPVGTDLIVQSRTP